jgi:hypothetical protein
VEHVARTEENKNGHRFLLRKPDGKGTSEDTGVDGWITKRILRKEGWAWTGLIWLRIGTNDGFL